MSHRPTATDDLLARADWVIGHRDMPGASVAGREANVDLIADLAAEVRALSARLAAACAILDAHAEICSRAGAYTVLKGHAARLRAAATDPTPHPDTEPCMHQDDGVCERCLATDRYARNAADPTPHPETDR